MADLSELERKLALLEGRVQELSTRASAAERDEAANADGGWFSWDLARNLVWVVGIPAALIAGWQTLRDDIIYFGYQQRLQTLQAAVEKLDELQAMNSEIYRLQAQQEHDAAFAVIEAKRGRAQRLTRDLYTAWEAYPDEFTPYEATALAEALLLEGRNDRALAVTASIDQTGMSPIELGDMDILETRILFADGPAQDPEAARDAFRDAMRHADTLDNEGQGLALIEKYVGVRLINELWLGTDCAEVVPFHGFLSDLVGDDKDGLVQDAVRANTRLVLEGHALKCGEGS